MSNYHIDGVSGSGKTTVAVELQKRGYYSVDADEDFGYFADLKTGEPSEKIGAGDNWIWKKKEVIKILESESNKPQFLCGGAMNTEEFKPLFRKTFILCITDEVLKFRLLTRTNNDYGKHPDELNRQLEWNQKIREDSKNKGYIIIDSSRPVSEVVDEILSNL